MKVKRLTIQAAKCLYGNPCFLPYLPFCFPQVAVNQNIPTTKITKQLKEGQIKP